MALYPDPLTAILGAIDSQNGITLVPEQYTFGTPQPYADPNGLLNTQMLVTVTDVLSPYTGSATVYYNRLSLASLATLLPLPLKFNGLTTIAQVAAAMNKFYGLNFGSPNGPVTNDITDGALTVAGDGSGNVTLTAASGSLGWIGTVTLPFILGNYDLAAEITVPTLPGLLYPETNETKPYAEAYSYWRDFSAQEATLQPITAPVTDFTQIAAALLANTNNTWQLAAADRYSLQNATMLYNGPTNAAPSWNGGYSSVNPSFSNVMLVTLDPTASLGYSGTLVMHYNIPGSDGIT